MALPLQRRRIQSALNERKHLRLFDGPSLYGFFIQLTLLMGAWRTTTAFAVHRIQGMPASANVERTDFLVTTTAPRFRNTRSTTVMAASSDATIRIAVTREQGKNAKLIQALHAATDLHIPLEIHELPCIAHADGADYPRLRAMLSDEPWDYIAVTSPEAARVLASAWPCLDAVHCPTVAAVGTATEQALSDANILVSFCPTKATAETLVAELPFATQERRRPRVLYPASTKAAETLQTGLQARGFDVTRLNTYDTITATWETAQTNVAGTCHIACFASPSAVKGWISNRKSNGTTVLAACIGETSAKACRKLGWTDETIFAAEQPGLDGWVLAILEAARSIPNESTAIKAATIGSVDAELIKD